MSKQHKKEQGVPFRRFLHSVQTPHALEGATEMKKARRTHKIWNEAKKRFLYHYPNWDFTSISWGPDGRSHWCKGQGCSERLIVGSIKIKVQAK